MIIYRQFLEALSKGLDNLDRPKERTISSTTMRIRAPVFSEHATLVEDRHKLLERQLLAATLKKELYEAQCAFISLSPLLDFDAKLAVKKRLDHLAAQISRIKEK